MVYFKANLHYLLIELILARQNKFMKDQYTKGYVMKIKNITKMLDIV